MIKCYYLEETQINPTGQNCNAFFTELISNFNPDIIKIQNTHTLEKYVLARYFPMLIYYSYNIPGCGNNIPIPIAKIRKIGK